MNFFFQIDPCFWWVVKIKCKDKRAIRMGLEEEWQLKQRKKKQDNFSLSKYYNTENNFDIRHMLLIWNSNSIEFTVVSGKARQTKKQECRGIVSVGMVWLIREIRVTLGITSARHLANRKTQEEISFKLTIFGHTQYCHGNWSRWHTCQSLWTQ